MCDVLTALAVCLYLHTCGAECCQEGTLKGLTDPAARSRRVMPSIESVPAEATALADTIENVIVNTAAEEKLTKGTLVPDLVPNGTMAVAVHVFTSYLPDGRWM